MRREGAAGDPRHGPPLATLVKALHRGRGRTGTNDAAIPTPARFGRAGGATCWPVVFLQRQCGFAT